MQMSFIRSTEHTTTHAHVGPFLCGLCISEGLLPPWGRNMFMFLKCLRGNLSLIGPRLSGKEEMNVETFGWRGRLESCGLVHQIFALQMKFGKRRRGRGFSTLGWSCRGKDKKKVGNGMKRVTMQKEEGIHEKNRQTLCWLKVTDGNSRLESQHKGRSRFVCDRNEKNEQNFCVRQTQTLDKTSQEQKGEQNEVSRGCHAKRVKIHQDWNWEERRKTWHERKERHLQASNNSSFGAGYMRRKDCKYGLCAALNFRVLNLLHKQKTWDQICLLADICGHVHAGCTLNIEWDRLILSDICDEFQIFCKQVKGNYLTMNMKVLLK